MPFLGALLLPLCRVSDECSSALVTPTTATSGNNREAASYGPELIVYPWAPPVLLQAAIFLLLVYYLGKKKNLTKMYNDTFRLSKSILTANEYLSLLVS